MMCAKKKIVAVSAVGITALSAIGAHAATIPLVYENGPKVGQPYAGGALTIQLTNFEVGTLYPSFALNSSAGYSGVPSPSGVNSGVVALDGLAAVTPAGAQARGQYPGANGNQEDGWGIFEVNDIKDASGFNLFTPAGKGMQLTGIFYGEQDFYLKQTTATLQSVSGAGLQADFYESPLMTFDPTPGTAGRTPTNLYPGATDGSFVMHVNSVPGFINGPGVLGGTATEFQSSYDYNDGTGRGQAFADVAPGSQEYSILHSQSFASAYGFGNADLNFTYTDSPAGVSDWLVQSNDPVKAVAVPEPATLGFLGVIGTGLLSRKRRGLTGRTK